MKKIQHYIEYISLSIFATVIRLFPLSFARFIARRLADLVFYVIPIRKKLVIGSLRHFFKDQKSPNEIKKIARAVYQQFSQTMMELLFFPKFSIEEIAEMVEIENLSIIEKVKKNGRGAVLVGAHFGNWEFMGVALAKYFPVTFVIGQQKNLMVDNLLNSYRINKGVKLIPLKLALRGVLKALKGNELIAILSDQDAHEDGTFVDFLGRPASTPKGPALFALKAGCPLMMGTIFRKNGKFKVVFEEIPKPESSGDLEKDIQSYTAAYTKVLENHIKNHPDHWFWLHRRWKTKPKAVSSS